MEPANAVEMPLDQDQSVKKASKDLHVHTFMPPNSIIDPTIHHQVEDKVPLIVVSTLSLESYINKYSDSISEKVFGGIPDDFCKGSSIEEKKAGIKRAVHDISNWTTLVINLDTENTVVQSPVVLVNVSNENY